MDAWGKVAVDEVLVDAVVDDVPLVAAGNLQDGVVGRAEDAVFGLLADDQIVFRVDVDGAEWRLRRAVAHVVVGRAGVVDRPEEIVRSLAVEHVGSLAEGPGVERAALGRQVAYGLLLHREQVVAELGPGHEAVAPVEVVLAALRVAEHVDVDGLSAAGLLRTVGIGDDGRSAVYERAGGRVAHGHANLLALRLGVVGREVEVIFVGAILLFNLLDARSPGITRGPADLVALHVEHLALVGPVLEVGRREDAEVVAAPSGRAVGGAVDVVLLRLVGVEHLGVGVESWQYGLREVAVVAQQTLLLGPRDGDDGAVAGGELALRLGVLHELEGLQVFRAAELVVAAAVAVVHDNPALAVDGAAHADTLHGLFGLFHVAVDHLPAVGQLTGHGLVDAAPRLLLVEEVVELVGLVVDNVAVDGGVAGVEEPAWLALQVGEVAVGVLVVYLVEATGVAGAQRVEHHVLLGLVVVDGLRRPYADDVLPRLGVACGEVHGGVLPVDEVGRFEQHHAPVAAPSESGAHVCRHHVERLPVFAAQYVGVSHALCQRDGVALDDGQSVVQRCVVIAVVGDGVAYLLVLRVVAVEVREEVGHHLVGVLRLFHCGFLFLRQCCKRRCGQQCGSQ